ncbi:MAG: hypothetical protein LBU91_03290, partial [Bacteroidales bacterium]|nr:hypothetical protein [Bacteroidales bacterium]
KIPKPAIAATPNPAKMILVSICTFFCNYEFLIRNYFGAKVGDAQIAKVNCGRLEVNTGEVC